MARAKPCALLAPLALRYAHRVGETPASAPLRRSLPAYGGSSHSFSVVHLSGGVGLCLPRLSVLSSLPFDSILFRSYLFRAAARFICLAAAGSALRAVADVAAVGTGPVARASPRAGPQLPALVPPLLSSRPPFGRATGRAVETFFFGYAQKVPNVACVFYEATTSWADQEPWHPTKAVPTVPSSLSAPLLWGRVGEAVQEWSHVDHGCVPSSLHYDLRESIPAPPLYCLRLPRLPFSPRRLRRSTSAAATFCHCLRSAHLFRSMAGGFSNCVVDV